MSFDIRYSNDYYLLATVKLECDLCSHRGIATYSWQNKSEFWWLSSIENDDDGQPDFARVPGAEFVKAVYPYYRVRLTDLHHCDKVVFRADILDPPWELGLVPLHPDRGTAATFRLLRKIARISEGRLARESGIDIRIIKAIQKGEIAITTEIADAIKSTFRNHKVSDISLSVFRNVGTNASFGGLYVYNCTTRPSSTTYWVKCLAENEHHAIDMARVKAKEVWGTSVANGTWRADYVSSGWGSTAKVIDWGWI